MDTQATAHELSASPQGAASCTTSLGRPASRPPPPQTAGRCPRGATGCTLTLAPAATVIISTFVPAAIRWGPTTGLSPGTSSSPPTTPPMWCWSGAMPPILRSPISTATACWSPRPPTRWIAPPYGTPSIASTPPRWCSIRTKPALRRVRSTSALMRVRLSMWLSVTSPSRFLRIFKTYSASASTMSRCARPTCRWSLCRLPPSSTATRWSTLPPLSRATTMG